ncbi:phage holin family protein [Rhodohalobacter mucosus]|uniref:Holin-X, holin superfamily III n=1 Tax=Rhodohalobacter mucosus TaxID=2079485 RepID=A0A316TSQ0_9BACT|nr:phage holin family protein [Rhodohalobacter mucosus]PWN06671.1 hypothetical protein DDZ15_09150 [Rhodohalobacter mucosus]
MENDNNSQHNEAQNLTAGVKLYIEKRVELFTLTVAEQVSLIAAQSIQKIIGLLLLAGALFFLWFALGFLVGDWIDNTGLGFLIMSVPLFVAAFIFAKNKSEKLTGSIQSDMIQKTLENVNSEFGRQLTENKRSEGRPEEKK